MHRIIGLQVVLVCLSAVSAWAAEIELKVKDPSGQPVAATGTILALPAGVAHGFETDESGVALFSDLALGRYQISVAGTGFTAEMLVVDVDAETRMSREVTLSIGTQTTQVQVVASTPLAGVDLDLMQIPSPVQTATARQVEQSGAINMADFMNKRLANVFLNEVQGNPFQADLNYRGYTASPLLGTPQGISIYMDGVRLNQPFGDVVSWDLIPRAVIGETTLMPGSNPLFGLNTLGGAISLRTKDGYSAPGTTLSLSGGNYGRKIAELEHGGSAGAFNWYGAGNLFFDDGWRQNSPSNVRQFFGKVGWTGERTSMGLSTAYANNRLVGNGLQELRLLANDYTSNYTIPDITSNRSPFLNYTFRHAASEHLSFSGNAYYRYIRTNSVNGDINEGALDQSVYQPNAAERAALAAAGFSGFPASGENANNTPFPKWRCIANALLQDEPGEKCNGLLNRGHSKQYNYGFSAQMTWQARPGNGRNQFTAGTAFDANRVRFDQLTELGYLNSNRSVTGVGAFADGVTGGDVDGEPFDTQVNLKGHIHTFSLYGTDTWSPTARWNITLSGRYNRTTVDNTDLLRPLAGPGSLTGNHAFQRFNPAAGATYTMAGGTNAYVNYSEGNRAPTSIELGCADPETPCKLPNAMAGDPPLDQVVARTIEAGLRSTPERRLHWSAGFYRTQNSNDILFVGAVQNGFGYFKNFGKTRRQGLESSFDITVKKVTWGVNYTYLDATFQSPESVNGTGNSSNDAAQAGSPGLESVIEIRPGDRIPLIPAHMLKSFLDINATSRLSLNLNLMAFSSSYARGNENNQHQADGVYYLGPGKSGGYAVVNLGGRYRLHQRVELFAQLNNLLDRKYYSASQIGPVGVTAAGNFVARPLPAIDGEFPIRQSTFFAPGAPRTVWGGVRLRF